MHECKDIDWRNTPRTTRARHFVEMMVHDDVFEPQVYRVELNDVVLSVPEDFDDEVVLRLLHLARAC